MPDRTDALLPRVRVIMPELEIEQIEIDPEGLINEVVIVNQKYVFRYWRFDQYLWRNLREKNARVLSPPGKVYPTGTFLFPVTRIGMGFARP
jgi:hypothetical protein